jgi:hypothetical protein
MSDRSQLNPASNWLKDPTVRRVLRENHDAMRAQFTPEYPSTSEDVIGTTPDGVRILRPVVPPDSFPSGLPDPVKRPAHYTRGGVEVIDFIDQTLDGYTDPRVAHYVGCAIKYLARAPHKGAPQQDLEKAEWYLRRAINRVASKKG